MIDRQCPCACHGQGLYGTCDIPGGCGSVGCDYLAEHRCASGDRCMDREPVRDGQGRYLGSQPRRIDVARGLCRRCESDVEWALNQLTGDVVELTSLIGQNRAWSETYVAASRNLPVPINVQIEALRAEIDDELTAWVEPVAEALGVSWDTSAAGHTRMAVRVQRAAVLLANSVDSLLALPAQEHATWKDGEPVFLGWDPELEVEVRETWTRDGVDAGLAFIVLHQRARAAAGRTKLVHRLPTPCPWCDFRTLVRHNGADQVTCENCRRHIEERHYSWFVAVLVDLEKRRSGAAMGRSAA